MFLNENPTEKSNAVTDSKTIYKKLSYYRDSSHLRSLHRSVSLGIPDVSISYYISY